MNPFRRFESISEQRLDRLLRAGISAVVVGIVLVGIVYFFDQRASTEPTLLERQTTSAEAAVRKTPNNIGLRLKLAEIYRVADKPDKALEQYDDVLKVESSHRVALLGRAEILAAKGRLTEAAKSFEKVIGKSGGEEFSSVDPLLASAYYGLGSVALKQNRMNDAMLALERAVRIEPADGDTLYLLGTAALKAGHPGRAVKALRQAILFVPTGWCEPYDQLSAAYTALNRKPQAEYAGAMVDFCKKRPDDAARRLKPLTSGPAAVDAMLGLGMIAEAQSDRAGAIRWYRKVLAKDSKNFSARSGLSRVSGAKSPGTQSPGHSSTGTGG